MKSSLKRSLTLIIGVLVGSMIVFDLKAQELGNSLLWKIENENIAPSYVYGTFHILPQKDFEIKPSVSKAFEESKKIVLELDMDDPSLQMEMMQHARMKNDQTLDELMSEEEYSMINRILSSTTGVGIEAYNSMKPFVLSSMLIPTLIEGRPASFEATFTQMASSAGKETLGLESPKEQMEVFDQISYQSQVNDLLDIIKKRDEMKSMFSKMVETYKSEEIDSMYNMIVEYMDDQEEVNYLLHERNKRWIGRIGDLAKDETTFFGVGAGHLGGDDGLLSLLRREGYTVTPVK